MTALSRSKCCALAQQTRCRRAFRQSAARCPAPLLARLQLAIRNSGRNAVEQRRRCRQPVRMFSVSLHLEGVARNDDKRAKGAAGLMLTVSTVANTDQCWLGVCAVRQLPQGPDWSSPRLLLSLKVSAKVAHGVRNGQAFASAMSLNRLLHRNCDSVGGQFVMPQLSPA
jgi:hypothetical protein